ncbi:hypothetical protein BB560_007166 [Smittium megazygosporum]|uniref:Tyrosinase copper-binding domain-containing protein n=1 Tax=Smittium megazygosporum TaxID=133381 RepID=A0A2T9XY85_9FUNG|nr:hypothetical protein BB560_007166 [Smittium megazygosporum]
MFFNTIKLVSILALYTICQFGTTLGQTADRCTGPITTRKEIKTLTPSELGIMQDSITKMHGDGWFDWFGYIHNFYQGPIHGYPEFFPWHRYFVREYEMAGQHYNPSFAAHYWDSSVDYAGPAGSMVFSDGYWGGNGVGNNMCIGSGFQRNWQRQFPNPGCVSRNFNGGNSIRPWISPESITSALTSSRDYDSIISGIENGIHAAVHVGIGGDMNTMVSPNDSIFFLHHSFMDYLWWKWQSSSPDYLMNYSGVNDRGASVSVSDRLTGFNIPVSDVMAVGYGEMCYTYNTQSTLSKRDRNSSKSSRSRSLYRDISDQNKELVSDPQEIQKVTQVPTMSLVALLNTTILDEFFPGVVSGEVSPETIHMPDVVTTKAVDYANQYLENSSDQVNTTVVPVASTSITDSLLATVNDNCLNCTDTGTGSDASSQRRLRSGKFNRELSTNEVPETPDNLKMPIPARIPESFLRMNNMDIDKYNRHYEKQVQLADILNQAGYVSPYI